MRKSPGYEVSEKVRFALNPGTIPGIGRRPRSSHFFHSGTTAGTAKHPDVEKRSRRLHLGRELERIHDHEAEFCAPADRLRSVVARERQIPRVLEEARQNISNPPGFTRKWRCSKCPTTSSSFKMMFRQHSRRCRIPSCWRTSRRVTTRPSKPCASIRISCEPTCYRLRTAIFASERRISARNCCTTRWWTFLWIVCSKSATPICGATSSNSKRLPPD